MVKTRVAETHTSEGDKAIGRALGKLERVSLHKIKSKSAIETICREVILRVDGVGNLVHITHERLELLRQAVKKNVKKSLNSDNPSELSEMELIQQNAKIRSDWNTLNWKLNPPHGWAWREEIPSKGKSEKPKNEIVALVYEIKSDTSHPEIFLESDILVYPRGALALIENMTKRHAALMAWNKRQQKIQKKQK